MHLQALAKRTIGFTQHQTHDFKLMLGRRALHGVASSLFMQYSSIYAALLGEVPIYEYRCEDCGEQVEILVRFGANTSPACPNCGSNMLDRLLSVPYVITSESRPAGRTCCGLEERCEMPPCSGDRTCRREA